MNGVSTQSEPEDLARVRRLGSAFIAIGLAIVVATLAFAAFAVWGPR